MRLRYARSFTLSVFVFLLLSTFTATAQSGFIAESVKMRIYRDGLAHITQTVSVDQLLPDIELPLLSSSIENLIILDENQLPVDYKIDATKLTVFTLGTSSVSIEYDTMTLTNKVADVWTLFLNNPYNLTLFLPHNSTIVYLNKVPTTIDATGTELCLSLHPGQWELSYIVPLQQGDQNGKGFFPPIQTEYLLIAVAMTVTIVGILVFLALRRRKINVKKIVSRNPGLMKEDIAVIEFLAENDGKAFEAEIRAKFPDMPRTSLWRLVKRLEGLEIVEVKKIGLENQVQLK